MPEMVLKKEVLDWLIAAQSGYSHFADYHKRFGYKKENIYCKCGQKRLKFHPFSGLSVRAFKFKLVSIINRRLLTQKEILGMA